MDKYIHIKSGKLYSLLDKTMFKQNGEWIKNLVIYKTEYDNPDGTYFVRTKEDFDKSFRKAILKEKYGIKCRRVVDSLLLNPNWYVPNDSNPYDEDWSNNKLYDTYKEAEKARKDYEDKDFTKNYLIYKVETYE